MVRVATQFGVATLFLIASTSTRDTLLFMPDIVIPAGKFAIISVIGRGPDSSGGEDELLEDGSVTITVSDPTKIYAARTSAAHVQPYQVAIVPKVQANVGGSYQVNFAINGSDGASGTSLPTLTQIVEVDGPPPTPQAAFSIKLHSVTFDDLVNAPADPGTGTITL